MRKLSEVIKDYSEYLVEHNCELLCETENGTPCVLFPATHKIGVQHPKNYCIGFNCDGTTGDVKVLAVAPYETFLEYISDWWEI